jgi:uncharacterized RDD family membrane protein YckC
MTEKKFYAGFWVRLFAGLLDILFLLPPVFLIGYFLSDSSYEIINIGENFKSYSAGTSGDLHMIDLVCYAISIIYITYFLASNKQATIGKRMMGIYVGNLDGSKLSRARAIFRAAASMITSATLGIGFIIVIFTKEKIALHDFLCNTRVFHGKK